jgi:subtilisin family serine protease
LPFSEGANAPSNRNWHLEKIGLPLPNNNNNRGKGIVIGHIDTGKSNHPELKGVYNPSGNELNCLASDLLVGMSPNSAMEPDVNLIPNILVARQRWHGTGTASLLASRFEYEKDQSGRLKIDQSGAPIPGSDSNEIGEWNRQRTGGYEREKCSLIGVASEATVLPVRAFDNVAINSPCDIAKAIWHLVNQEVAIISMSLVTLPELFLEAVIDYAVFNDIIVIASAGQYAVVNGASFVM